MSGGSFVDTILSWGGGSDGMTTIARNLRGATGCGELFEEILKALALGSFVAEILGETAKERWRGDDGAYRGVHGSRCDGPCARCCIGDGVGRDSRGACRSIHDERIDNKVNGQDNRPM